MHSLPCSQSTSVTKNPTKMMLVGLARNESSSLILEHGTTVHCPLLDCQLNEWHVINRAGLLLADCLTFENISDSTIGLQELQLPLALSQNFQDCLHKQFSPFIQQHPLLVCDSMKHSYELAAAHDDYDMHFDAPIPKQFLFILVDGDCKRNLKILCYARSIVIIIQLSFVIINLINYTHQMQEQRCDLIMILLGNKRQECLCLEGLQHALDGPRNTLQHTKAHYGTMELIALQQFKLNEANSSLQCPQSLCNTCRCTIMIFISCSGDEGRRQHLAAFVRPNVADSAEINQ